MTGHKLTLKVDGKLAAEVCDDDPNQFDAAGILGLQLHSGPPTVAQWRQSMCAVLVLPHASHGTNWGHLCPGPQ